MTLHFMLSIYSYFSQFSPFKQLLSAIFITYRFSVYCQQFQQHKFYILCFILMGNFQQRLTKARPLQEFEKTIKHLQETRSDSEVEITTRLANLLSDVNTERVMNAKTISAKDLNWNQYVFVCIQGLPALTNEFSMLDLPGESVYFSGINFSEEALNSNEQLKFQRIYQSTFKKEAERLNQLFSQIQKNKIILVYHSAGNFILSMYFYYYGYGLTQKIKGMIDIAGGPLRYYLSAQVLLPIIMDTDVQQIIQNGDKVHKFFLKSLSSTGFDMGFKSKYETLSFIHYIKSPNYGQVFDATWNHPNVLKLFMHGRNDSLFNSDLLNEKAIYYTYRKELDKNYEEKLIKKYNNLYKPKVSPKNLQQRFIFAIPKGQHSVHNQSRNHELMRNAVQQYLTIIHE